MPDINYVINDPTTPELTIGVDLPTAPANPNFKVEGYIGATQTVGTVEHQAACCYYTIVKGLGLVEKYFKQPLNKWAATNTLFVQTRAGKQLNAFYDRNALRFFYANDPITKQIVYAANSTDVVSHELGHAILDALRPDLYNVQAMEIWAFHESFGDMNAILNVLQFDVVLEFMLKETGGNLRQSNIATKLAEEMGNAIYHLTAGRMGHTVGFLRNAFNTFTYVEPEKLSRQGLDNQISSEPHNFSRIFTGAWYDILVAIYEEQLKTMPAKEALITARDILGAYTFQAIPIAAATIRFFDSFARAMLVIDKANDYKYNELINKVFISRGILREVVKPMLGMDWDVFKSMVDFNDEVLESNSIVAVRNKSIETISLPVRMMNVEAPADAYYEFNNGECVATLSSSIMEIVEHVEACVDFLKSKDMIRPDSQAPFELDNSGNLKRSHFSCCGNFSDNCQNPQAPEYKKCWKQANNSGCGCNHSTTTVTSSNTREGCATVKVNNSSVNLSSVNVSVKNTSICKTC